MAQEIIDGDTLSKNQDIDGEKWAQAFCKQFATYPKKENGVAVIDGQVDFATIHGWFANAIEAGRNHERNKQPKVEVWKDDLSKSHFIKTEANDFVGMVRVLPITDEVAESIDKAIKESGEICERRGI